MCKFNNYVFVLILFVVLYIEDAQCAPKRLKKFRDYSDDYNYSDDEFDLNYDQRQNGSDNIRIMIDGVVIAVPGPESSSNNDVVSLLGGLFDEFLNGANYDDGDLLTGEQLSNDNSDKDKLSLYEFEHIDANNSTTDEVNTNTTNGSKTSELTTVRSPSEEQSSSVIVPTKLKEKSKQSNVSYGQNKLYGGQRRRNKFHLIDLLKPFLKH